MKKTIPSCIIALMLVATITIPVMADEITASVTVNSVVSVTITDNGDDGLIFGNLDDGADKVAEANSPAASVTVTTGTENNVNVIINISGTDFSGTAGTFDIDNAWYNTSDDSVAALAMSATPTQVGSVLGASATLNIYHWLSIPDGQAAGSYSSTFTYTSVTQ